MSNTKNCFKKRRRTKQLVRDIKEQVEFYFSDANLNRDKFLQGFVGQNGNNYIALELLLTFNQLQHLGADINLLQKAIKLSDQLQLSDDLKTVKRKACFIKPIPSDIDHSTIVIDRLPANASIQWLKAVCRKFGCVSYITLPRYKSDLIKGFAFVEFTRSADAALACSVLNSPPRNFFPKLQQFTSHIKNKLSLQCSSKTCAIRISYSEDEVPKAKKRRLCDDTDEAQSDADKRVAPKSTYENNNHCDYDLSLKHDDKQSKNNLVLNTSSIDTLEASSDNQILKEDDSLIVKPTVKSKITCVRNCKNKRDAVDSVDSYYANDGNPSKKAKVCNINALKVNQSFNGSEIFSAKKKRRKRKCREKSKKGKTNKESNKKINLYAMMKPAWDEFKKSYLREQRENFGKLKSILQKCSSPDPETTSVYIKHHLALKKSAAENFLDMSDPETEELENHIDEEQKPQTSTSVFISGVVVSLSSLTVEDHSGMVTPLPHFKAIKSYFEQYGSVAYVDVKPGSIHGFVRFETSDAAQHAIMEEKQYGLCLLTSVQEERYWDDLLISRQLKRTRERERLRGKQRLVLRAEKRTDVASTRHIKFNANF